MSEDYDEGYETGYKEGIEEGISQGIAEAKDEWYERGVDYATKEVEYKYETLMSNQAYQFSISLQSMNEKVKSLQQELYKQRIEHAATTRALQQNSE